MGELGTWVFVALTGVGGGGIICVHGALSGVWEEVFRVLCVWIHDCGRECR